MPCHRLGQNPSYQNVFCISRTYDSGVRLMKRSPLAAMPLSAIGQLPLHYDVTSVTIAPQSLSSSKQEPRGRGYVKALLEPWVCEFDKRYAVSGQLLG